MSNKKILIIEDDKEIFEIMKFILEDKGFEVISSEPQNIFEDLKYIQPDLILLDDWLPIEKGSVICKKLKANPEFSHIPVFLLSAANGLSITASECLADGYIEKPFDLDHLERKINEVFN